MKFLEEELATIMPFVKNHKIKNEGIIKEANLKFKKGLNLIVGPNATGKTTVLKSIIKKSGTLSFPANSLIEMNKFNGGGRIVFLFTGLLGLISARHSDSCLVVDDLFGRLDAEKKTILLNSMINLNVQIITTATNDQNSLKHLLKKGKINIIYTKSFVFCK